MNHLPTYQINALRTEAPQPTSLARLGHAGLGFASESGEIATQIKRIAFYGKNLDSLDKDGISLRKHIREELGDTMWYMAIACDALGADFGKVYANLSAHACTLEDSMFALSTACGQFNETVLSHKRFGWEPSQTLQFSLQFSVMLNDIAQSLVDIAGHIGTDLDTLAGENIAKLTLRYPDSFSFEAAEARADKGGLDARNS